jgi:hypothetical protein
MDEIFSKKQNNSSNQVQSTNLGQMANNNQDGPYNLKYIRKNQLSAEQQ